MESNKKLKKELLPHVRDYLVKNYGEEYLVDYGIYWHFDEEIIQLLNKAFEIGFYKGVDSIKKNEN